MNKNKILKVIEAHIKIHGNILGNKEFDSLVSKLNALSGVVAVGLGSDLIRLNDKKPLANSLGIPLETNSFNYMKMPLMKKEEPAQFYYVAYNKIK